MVVAEAGVLAERVREDLDEAVSAAHAMQDRAASLVADHGRTLVRLERATHAASRSATLRPPPTGQDAPQAPGSGSGLVRKTGLSLLTQAITATATAILTLFLIRVLEPAEYGVFSLVMAITGLLLLPADFGISGSAARFIAEGRSNIRAVAAIFADALRLKLVISLVLGLALVALAGVVADIFRTPELTLPLQIAAVGLVGQSLMLLFTSAFLAVGRIGSNLRLVAGESIVELSASVVIVLAGAGAAGAATGRSIGYAVGAIVGALLAARAFGRTAVRPGLKPRSGYRRLVRYAGALFVVDGAFALFNQIDILLIGRLLGSASVGLFAAPLRLCTVLHYPGLAVSNAVSPRVARAVGHAPDTRAFSVGLRGLIVLQVAIAVPILVWAQPIVDLLLGPSYAESAPVLRALTPFIVLQGLGPLISVSVNFLGQARRRIPIAIAAVVVNIVLDLILIPRIGVIGAAIGTDVAYAIYVPAHFLICRRMLDLDVRPILLTCARALAAGVVMAGPLLLAADGGLGVQGWVLGGGAALAAFAGALLLTGELTTADVRSLLARITRRSARAA